LARRDRLSKLVEETLEVLADLGIPVDGMTTRRKIKMAKAFLSVAGMKPGMTWAEARSNNRLRSRDVIRWMNEYLGENVSSGSYDDIRRKDLLLPVEAGLVMRSAGKENAATNDGTRTYALAPEAAELLRKFGTSDWRLGCAEFIAARGNLAQQLVKLRSVSRVPITLGTTQLHFGPGAHNELQKAILESFLPLFGQGAEVLYVGDTENKLLYVEEARLLELGFFQLAHDKLPDVLAYSKIRNWLFVIEAVHSSNPITELRKRALEELTRSCVADIIYVSAFLDRTAFRRFAREIAWESEVWIAESPHHLIHFNGDKFLGPHVSSTR
jgi:type II restriction enzyme